MKICEQLEGTLARVHDRERTLIASALSGQPIVGHCGAACSSSVASSICRKTGLHLNHAPKHYQKFVSNVSWVIGIRNDNAVRDSHVADDAENDTLCPDGMLVLSPVRGDGREG